MMQNLLVGERTHKKWRTIDYSAAAIEVETTTSLLSQYTRLSQCYWIFLWEDKPLDEFLWRTNVEVRSDSLSG